MYPAPPRFQSTHPTGTRVEPGVLANVLWWMAVGLGLTGVVALVTASSDALLNLIFGTPLFWGLIIAELGLVFGLSLALPRLSPTVAAAMFLIYAAINGLTMSAIFILYTTTSIATTFFIAGGMFAAMALYGTTTKRDLSSWGTFLFMGLIGIIIPSWV